MNCILGIRLVEYLYFARDYNRVVTATPFMLVR